MSDFVAYLVVVLALFFTLWRFLPGNLKRQVTPMLVRLFGQRVSKKLETAGGCGSCDSCNACGTPAKPEVQPVVFKK